MITTGSPIGGAEDHRAAPVNDAGIQGRSLLREARRDLLSHLVRRHGGREGHGSRRQFFANKTICS